MSPGLLPPGEGDGGSSRVKEPPKVKVEGEAVVSGDLLKELPSKETQGEILARVEARMMARIEAMELRLESQLRERREWGCHKHRNEYSDCDYEDYRGRNRRSQDYFTAEDGSTHNLSKIGGNVGSDSFFAAFEDVCKLKGRENVIAWRTELNKVLLDRSATSFVDGTFPSTLLSGRLKTEDRMVAAAIFWTLDSSLYQQYQSFRASNYKPIEGYALDLLNRLLKDFEEGSFHAIYLVVRDLMNMTFEPDDDVDKMIDEVFAKEQQLKQLGFYEKPWQLGVFKAISLLQDRGLFPEYIAAIFSSNEVPDLASMRRAIWNLQCLKGKSAKSTALATQQSKSGCKPGPCFKCQSTKHIKRNCPLMKDKQGR